MYNCNDIADRIKKMAKSKKIIVKIMLSDVGLGFNTMSNMKTSMPKADTIAKIADYLDCSVDYLLGRENPQMFSTGDVTNNNGVVGHINAPTTINNAKSDLSEQEQALIKIYKNLDVVKQSQLIVYAAKLEKEE